MVCVKAKLMLKFNSETHNLDYALFLKCKFNKLAT